MMEGTPVHVDPEPLAIRKEEEGEQSISKPHACRHCGKCFNNADLLSNHEIWHAVKPFTCKYCDESFQQYAAAKKHERIHIGEKPYKCPICAKGFSTYSQLRTHQLKQKHETEVMEYQADPPQET